MPEDNDESLVDGEEGSEKPKVSNYLIFFA